MANTSRILAFAGSTREKSFNKNLVKIAAAGAVEAGAEVSLVDLRDFPMPLYDGDLEEREGAPVKAIEFRDLLKNADGVLIASPEYNSSITAVLKNAIDWASRPVKGEASVFSGKTAAILSASPGGFGGMRGLVHLRMILGNLGMLVIPESTSVSAAHQALDESGNLVDSKQEEKVKNVGKRLAEVTGRMVGE